jgi:hypothetical protein
MQKDVSVRVAWRIITTLVVAAIGSQGADFEHFTWWSIAWWAIYGMLEELGYGKSFFWFFMTIQVGARQTPAPTPTPAPTLGWWDVGVCSRFLGAFVDFGHLWSHHYGCHRLHRL